MKKWIALMLALVMVFSLSACGSKKESKPKKEFYKEQSLLPKPQGLKEIDVNTENDMCSIYYYEVNEENASKILNDYLDLVEEEGHSLEETEMGVAIFDKEGNPLGAAVTVDKQQLWVLVFHEEN